MWPEVEAARNEKRREINLSGKKISEIVENEGFDQNLFLLDQLNLLNINSTTIDEIPGKISELSNLQTLMLFKNQIQTIPVEISQLTKLKVIDFSYNKIEKIPEEFKNLIHLNFLLLSNNCIKEFVGLAGIPLHTLDLSNNQLSSFPEVSKDILELKLNINQITNIPDNVDQLSHLKLLELSENKIDSVPKSLANISKLKDLHLKGNPLKDKRLLKLVDQCHQKSITDYIKKNGREPKKEEKVADEKKEKISGSQGKEKVASKIIIHKYDENRGFKILYGPEVKEIRQFIICCLIKNVTFSQSSFQKFLNMQTKIHESELCDRREKATIGTHDFDAIKSNLVKFTAKLKNQIKIVPLGRQTAITAGKYFEDLKNEADSYRKEKKRSALTGIYKYLGLLKGDVFVCIEDGSGQVLSLPPLTNSDVSKITMQTKNIFIEVTSSKNFQVCKNVMEALIDNSLKLKLSDDGSGDSNSNVLWLEQLKIFDLEGNLKTVYPSKVDLMDFDKKDVIVERGD